MAKPSQNENKSLVKIVYFDEESASDLIDIVAGGKETSSRQRTQDRTAEIEAKAGAKAVAKFDWLPFFGGSAEASAAASASSVGRNILNKTLSNTILTDYLDKLQEIKGVERLEGLAATASKESAAYVKMYTPYLAMLKVDDLPVNLAALDEALMSAKGYYELLGHGPDGAKQILRFNIRAFRNSYGLADLGRMRLVFHGIRVGKAAESSLTMEAEMASDSGQPSINAVDVVDELKPESEKLLDVFDIILAGVEYG